VGVAASGKAAKPTVGNSCKQIIACVVMLMHAVQSTNQPTNQQTQATNLPPFSPSHPTGQDMRRCNHLTNHSGQAVSLPTNHPANQQTNEPTNQQTNEPKNQPSIPRQPACRWGPTEGTNQRSNQLINHSVMVAGMLSPKGATDHPSTG
jgi:hypothetical protein